MNRRIGLLGGGQLGRMLVSAASLLNLDVAILDVGTDSPAKQISSSSSHLDGSFSDPAKIRELANLVDILTVEIEHVDTNILAEIEKEGKVLVHPSPSTLRTIQDKYAQKVHLRSNGLPVADFQQVESSLAALEEAARQLSLPLMLKSRTLAYDGRGNFALHTLEHASEALSALGGRPLYAEKWAAFAKEIAVMVVRSISGEVKSYPSVETVHKDSVCHLVFAPLRHPNPEVGLRARRIAEKAVASFSGAGVFGVELFLMPDGELLINEIAPRPHNSGHYTIEACHTSQYENHLRAILDLPLGSTALKVPSAVMLNLLGESSDFTEISRVAEAALLVPGASVHLYGKKECRKGRKMGHITVVGESDDAVRKSLRPLLEALPTSQTDSSSSPSTNDLYAPPTPQHAQNHSFPLVGIIMGSDSDLPVMHPAAEILEQFKIPYELTIVSAHRTPQRMVQYAHDASSRGLRVIIAGAGGAAHLPGMVAALTSLPVIGVPVKGSSLDGVDSLYSIVQMPRGIPVATVAINNGTNAGLLAVRILGSNNEGTRLDMDQYLAGLETQVLDKVETLRHTGWEDYVIKK